MKNVPDIKLGIVVGSTDWLPSEIAVDIRKQLVEKYIEKYGEAGIYECQTCIADNELTIKRAMKELAKAECDAIALCFANYGPESSGTLMAQEFDGPVMMFAVADEGQPPFERDRRDAISGFINACYALKLRNTNVYIPSTPQGDIDECVEMLHDFMPIARTICGVKNLKVISIGPRPSSYLAASAPNHLLYDIGVEISEYSELELLDSYNKHAEDKRIEALVATMNEELDENKTPDIMPKLAQYELTMEDWIRNHKGNRKYVTLTSTCWPAFPVNFGFVPCYVNSRLTAKGTPVACEVDVYGAVSEYIGQCVSDDVVTILNINNNVPQSIYDERIEKKEFNGRSYKNSDLFIGYHCGVTPKCMLESSTLDYHFVNNQLIGEEQSKGTIQGRLKADEVTLLRVQGGRDGKLRAYVLQGQILPVSADTYGGYGIIAIPEMERFIRNVVIEKQFPNHAAVIIGHHGKKLMDILKHIGITEIYYNHPANLPYEKENVFSNLDEWY